MHQYQKWLQSLPERLRREFPPRRLALIALGAAIALKDYLDATGEDGTVIYFGCPAEEGAGSKQFMARAGLFDDVDFVYTWHPSTINGVESVQSRVSQGMSVPASKV